MAARRVQEIEFEGWLERYRQAWENRDPEAAAALFSPDAEYYETPFVAPARGREGVREYWANATRNQSDVCFSYETVCIIDDRGVARWWATFTRVPSGAKATLDGVFFLKFTSDGLCRELREWWHGVETKTQLDPR